MNSDVFGGMILFGMIASLYMFFRAGYLMNRHEKCLRNFRVALREKYPRSYVKQNKVIKFIRKKYGMDTKRTIHWISWFLYHLQFVIAVPSVLALFLLLFFSPETVAIIVWAVSAGTFGFLAVVNETLMLVQVARCNRMRKKDPLYSNLPAPDYRDKY